MTEMRDAIIFVGFWRPPNAPPSPDATKLNYLNDEGRALPFVGFWRPPPPSHDTTILNYLNDREKGRHYRLKDLAPLNAPPLPSDATILNYLNDRGGRHFLL